METGIVKTDTQAVATAQQPASLLEIIANAATDPRCDVAKMQALLNMKFQIEERDAKKEFYAAMSRLKSKLPQIKKTGEITDRQGAVLSRFARREDLDLILTPLLQEEGLSFSWGEEEVNQYGRRFVGKMAHRDGHSEEKRITLALDDGGFKNKTQASGSTASYACRYLLKMFLNWVEEGEDKDGTEDKTITEDQARDLRALITEVKQDMGRFLAWAGADKIENILATRYDAAIQFLNQKKARTV